MRTASIEVAPIQVSIVMPCLNEQATVQACVERAVGFLGDLKMTGEVVVADNGSTDNSPTIAAACGARVVAVTRKGYGNALMGGIEASRGRFIIMADADGSYDVRETALMIDKLQKGAELVMGCRLPWGGGRVMPGAMPALHRWLGNPMLTLLARVLFGVPIHDIYCGMRGFSRELYDRLELQCAGMEFATEMVIKAKLAGARIEEAPITLHPDGRPGHRTHLRTFRDGWRTVRFYLLFSPSWIFLTPAMGLVAAGMAGYIAVYGEIRIGGARLDANTLLCSSLFVLLGFQLAVFWLGAVVFSTNEGLRPFGRRLDAFFQHANLERGIALGSILIALGGGMILSALLKWRAVQFGDLDYASTMRVVIPGVLLAALGFQGVLSSLFISTLGMRRRRRGRKDE